LVALAACGGHVRLEADADLRDAAPEGLDAEASAETADDVGIETEDAREADSADATPDGGDATDDGSVLPEPFGCEEVVAADGIADLVVRPTGTGEHLGTFLLRSAREPYDPYGPLLMDLWRDGDTLNGCVDLGRRDESGFVLAAPLVDGRFEFERSVRYDGGCTWGTEGFDGGPVDDDGDGAPDRVSGTCRGVLYRHPGGFPSDRWEDPVQGGSDDDAPTMSCGLSPHFGPEMRIGFSEPIAPASLAAAGLRVRSGSGVVVPGRFWVAPDLPCGVSGLWFTPERFWSPGDSYALDADALPGDLAGNPVRGLCPPVPIGRPPDAEANAGFERGDLSGFDATGFEVIDSLPAAGGVFGPFEGARFARARYGYATLATILAVPPDARRFRMRARLFDPHPDVYGALPSVLVVVAGVSSGRRAAFDPLRRDRPALHDVAGEIGADRAVPATDWLTWAVDLDCLEDDALQLYLLAHLTLRVSCDVVESMDLMVDDVGFE
jgi:hypothetical protein